MSPSLSEPRAPLWQRAKTYLAAHLKRDDKLLLINSGSVAAAKAVNSLLGFAFWMVAARLYTSASVGLASAALSAMQLLGTIGALGLGTLLVRELPRRQGQRASLISASLVATGAVSGVLGIGFALISPLFSHEFSPLAASAAQVMIFGLGSLLNAVTVQLDRAYIGLLRGQLGLWRNTVFAASKLILLVAVGLLDKNASGTTIYVVWAASNLLSLLILAPSTLPKGIKWDALKPNWDILHNLRGAALGHHVLNLAVYSPDWVLPILATALISAEANAGFYMAMMIGGLLGIAPAALTSALLAVGSSNPRELPGRMRVSLGLSLLSGVLGVIVAFVGAEWLLGLFGASYAATASRCLRLIVFWLFPNAIGMHYISVCQIEGRMLRAAWVMGWTGVLGLGMAAAGAVLWGVDGLTLGWLVAELIRAAVVMPDIYRATRKPPVEAASG